MISVLMTIYKEPWEWIYQALKSIEQQTVQDIELVLVIDNPGNEYIERIKKYVRNHFKNAKVIVNTTNLGLVRSLNIAYNNATGSFIARMDSDDVALPDRVEKELYFLETNKLDFVCSSINLMDINGLIIKKMDMKNDILGQKIKLIESYQNQFWHPTWLMKKVVMDSLEGYRDIPSTEDYDFVARAILKDFQLGMLGIATVNKRFNKESISELDNYRQVVMADRIRDNLRKGRIVKLDQLPRIDSNSRDIYLEIKKKFEARNNLKLNQYIYLIYQLLLIKQGRLLLRGFLIQKFYIKCVLFFKHGRTK